MKHVPPVWDRIYRENVWNGVESRSGPGSGTAATTKLVPLLQDVIARYSVTSVLDVACGDGWWMPDLGVPYIGIDPSEEAIRLHRERHPERTLHVADVREWDRPADLVILRDVVQHQTLPDSLEIVRAAWSLGRLLFASTYPQGRNVGCDPGALIRGWAYDANLEDPPFSLPDPDEIHPDGYDYSVPGRLRDPGKWIGLWTTS